MAQTSLEGLVARYGIDRERIYDMYSSWQDLHINFDYMTGHRLVKVMHDLAQAEGVTSSINAEAMQEHNAAFIRFALGMRSDARRVSSRLKANDLTPADASSFTQDLLQAGADNTIDVLRSLPTDHTQRILGSGPFTAFSEAEKDAIQEIFTPERWQKALDEVERNLGMISDPARALGRS